VLAAGAIAQEKADSVLKLSLSQAQTYALENNRAIKSAKIDMEIAKKKVWETTTIGLPQFTVTADYQHLFKVPEFGFPTSGFTQSPLTFSGAAPEGFQQFTNTEVGNLNQYVYNGKAIPISPADNTTFNFTLSQLIFSGEYIVGLQAAKVYKELSEKSFVKSENVTRENVANGYHLVLVLGENLALLKKSLDVSDQAYNEVQGLYKQGFTEETNVDQLKINKSNIETLIRSLEGQYGVAQKLFKIQLGVDFAQNIVLTDSLSGVIDQGNFQYLSSSQFDVNQSVDFEMMKTQENLAALNYKRLKAKFLPTVAGFYRHQELQKEPMLNFQPKDVAGISVNLPIFTSGQRLSTVGQAKLELQKTRLAKETVSQSLNMEYSQAKTDYETAFNNYLTNKESMELSDKIYRRNIIKFREGVASSLELTQSQGQFLSAESTYYSSVLSLLNAKAKLERILIQYQPKN
jgi:outer membrane protein TolC